MALVPPTMGHLGELRVEFQKYYDSVFRVAVCRTVGLLWSETMSTLHLPTLVLLVLFWFKLFGVLSRRWMLIS
jgi:hypothetical protein